MIEAINSFAQIWVHWISSAGLQATALALLLMGIVGAGRRWPPALRHAILMIALIKFAFPPTLSLPTGLLSHFKPEPLVESTATARLVTPIIQDALWPPKSVGAASGPQKRMDLEALPGSKHAPFSRLSGRAVLSAAAWLLILHVLGAFVIVVRITAQRIRLRRLTLAALLAADPPLLSAFNELCGSMGLSRRPSLLLSPGNHAPMTFGLRRPVVLLPQALIEALPLSEVRLILGHELAHQRRGDLWLGWLQIPISVLWWFNPLYWLLARMIRHVREDCCDDLAVASGLARGESYCRTLLNAARVVTGNAPAGASLAYIKESHSLCRRFRRIMGARVIAAPRLTKPGIVTVAALGLLLLPGVDPRALQRTQASAQESVRNGYFKKWLSEDVLHIIADEERSSYRKWLDEDVVYIISQEERKAFQGLRTGSERERFIEQFWARRNPKPGAADNAFKTEHYRRIAYANTHFSSSMPGWKTDRGHIYILYGEPDNVEFHPLGFPAADYPLERWHYHHVSGIGDEVEIEFVDGVMSARDRRLTIEIRTDSLRLSSEKALLLVTVEMESDLDIGTIAPDVRIFGRVRIPNNRVVSEFEDDVSSAAGSLLREDSRQRARWLYQEAIPVPIGMEGGLDLTFTDLKSREEAYTNRRILAVLREDEELQASSVILADSIVPLSAVPSNDLPFALLSPDAFRFGRAFALGDMKVVPNVRSEFFTDRLPIHYYLQIYNAGIDPLDISCRVRSGAREVLRLNNLPDAIHSVSDSRVVITGEIPPNALGPGGYRLDIIVADRMANKSVTASTGFILKNP